MPLSSDLKDQARKLVDRAGHGDQNAMAMVEAIGKNARGGIALAQESHAVILEHLANRPPKEEPLSPDAVRALGALRDPSLAPDILLRILCALPAEAGRGSLEAAFVILAQGAIWSPERIGAVHRCVPPMQQPTFLQGLENAGDSEALRPLVEKLDESGRGVLTAGNCLGMARRLQGVRQGAPLSFLSANMGWELE